MRSLVWDACACVALCVALYGVLYQQWHIVRLALFRSSVRLLGALCGLLGAPVARGTGH